MSTPEMQPHDIRAEEEVIGTCLTSPTALGAVQAEVGLRPESFYRTDHRLIFTAMLALAAEGKPTDELTVGNLLEKDTEASGLSGGRDRLGALSVPVNPVHVLHYARIVRDKARWRERFDSGTRIREAAISEDSDAFASAQDGLVDAATNDRAMYDTDRQKDLLYELMEGKAKAEFFWPLSKLNRLQSGGMRRGQLIVLSGYTNEGKSHFAAQLLDVNRKHGKVCLYDNEMDPVEQAARRAARLADVEYGALLDGHLSTEQTKRMMGFLNSEELHWPIVDTSGWTVEEVTLHIRQYRWDFVVVDILHNFPFENEREIAAAVARLKAAARLSRCCIVLVAHVNRGGVQSGLRRRPVRSDLRWSGEIENLADAVCFVYREQDPETYEPTEDGFIYLDKCRGGKLGGERVRFDPERLRFELAEDFRELAGASF